MGKINAEAQLYSELDKIYYSPDEEASYSGVDKLIIAAKEKGSRYPAK